MLCDFQEVEVPTFQENRHINVVRLSALSTPGNITGIHFRYRLYRPQGHSATWKHYINEKFQ